MMTSEQKQVTREAAVKWFMKTQAEWIVREGIPEWFHGIITRKQAEDLLMNKPAGHFLIRVAESRIGYSLSYKTYDRCRHFMIDVVNDGQFIIVGEMERFRTLKDLVEHHKKSPILPYNEVLTVPCGQKTDSSTTDYEELLGLLVNKTLIQKSEHPQKNPAIRTTENTPKYFASGPAFQSPTSPPLKPQYKTEMKPLAVSRNKPEEPAPPLPPRSSALGAEKVPESKPNSLLENSELVKKKGLYPCLNEELKSLNVTTTTLAPFHPGPPTSGYKPLKAHSTNEIFEKKPGISEGLPCISSKDEAAQKAELFYTEINHKIVKKDKEDHHKAAPFGNLQLIKNSLPLIQDVSCPHNEVKSSLDPKALDTEMDKGAKKPGPHKARNTKENLLKKKTLSEPTDSELFEGQHSTSSAHRLPNATGTVGHATDVPPSNSQITSSIATQWPHQLILPAKPPKHVHLKHEFKCSQDIDVLTQSHTMDHTMPSLRHSETTEPNLKVSINHIDSLALHTINQLPNTTKPDSLPYEYRRPPPFAPGY
ncbi:uncharacterized protein LOC122817648 [Protopterus annectens]|uniref:uncharacterized protein LOC122817648 n=1 Tax=Protopterus annectens TaxID=7888 RepID=UPI001CFA78BA|nr:uncharacterized protein LOC122817648 [Protopterus annectens]XP_043946644.1 uncharacterized protein LOC122817648 [Protopterus annectens]